MPRTAKRTQPPEAPQDQGYGVRGEQIAAQRAVPLPDNRGATGETPMPAGGPAAAAGPGGPAGAAPTDPNALLAMLSQQAPPPAGGLARPTERPTEPITAGAAEEPMPAAAPNKAAEVLEQIFAQTGDQRFAALAQRARLT